MKILLAANTDWYLFNFRLPLARRLRDRGDEVVVVSPPGPYVARLEAEGLRWRPMRIERRSMNPVRELGTLASLYRIYREERPQLVHHFTPKCAIYGSIAARLARVPGIVNAVTGMGTVFSGDTAALRLARPVVRLLYRIAFSRGHIVFQNPEDCDDFVATHLADAGRARVIPGSGVDVERFVPGDAARNGEVRVLFVARLVADKGVEQFVEAAQRVRAVDPRVRFAVVGDVDPGNPLSIAPSRIEEWKRQGGVEFLGHREDVAQLMRNAHIFVLPTYYREGVPRSLIEAAASGLPLIASGVRGCTSVVIPDVNGVLVPPRNVEALA